jgi:hypothetical protein
LRHYMLFKLFDLFDDFDFLPYPLRNCKHAKPWIE